MWLLREDGDILNCDAVGLFEIIREDTRINQSQVKSPDFVVRAYLPNFEAFKVARFDSYDKAKRFNLALFEQLQYVRNENEPTVTVEWLVSESSQTRLNG